jgi:molybdenum cofactor cytidylyltransferase
VGVGAIVLAAGKSERMGRPKALLPIRGHTFLENILTAISRAPIHHRVIVVGHHRDEIEKHLQSAAVVFNPDYEQGMITSFQAGIGALPPGLTATFLFLVDHPLVEPSTIEALAAKADSARIVLPTFGGRRGHPVLFGSDVLEEIQALPSTQGANVVVHKDRNRITEVPVNDAGILVDVDTPEDFDRLQEQENAR